jgi:hypothetical protein
MKISKLSVTIESDETFPKARQMRVELFTGHRHISARYQFPEDDFQSNFDYLMEKARLEILKLVKQP